jgi:hypothetical protein
MLPLFPIVMASGLAKESRLNPCRVVGGVDGLGVGVICPELGATELNRPAFGTEDGCDATSEIVKLQDDPELATVDMRELGDEDGEDGGD